MGSLDVLHRTDFHRNWLTAVDVSGEFFKAFSCKEVPILCFIHALQPSPVYSLFIVYSIFLDLPYWLQNIPSLIEFIVMKIVHLHGF